VLLTHVLVAIQERANSSPGLQAFLEKKGDEHAFSCLYLIAGVICLYAAFSHGEDFCTTVSTADLAKHGPVLASAKAHNSRALLGNAAVATSRETLAEMKKGTKLEEEPAADSGSDAGEAAAADETPAGDDVPAEAPAAESDSGAAAEGGDAVASSVGIEPQVQKRTFLGPQGWVVTWLTVEGFTALGLPLVSIVMLLLRLHENACISCMLYLVAVFQAFWLIVGCVWAFGGFVPEACRDGTMGDNFAFNTMWCVPIQSETIG
jgi:hypothetical protein